MDINVRLPMAGELRSGYFYILDCHQLTDVSVYSAGLRQKIVGRSSPAGNRFGITIESQIESKVVAARKCPSDPSHVTQCHWVGAVAIPFVGPITPVVQAISDDGTTFIHSELRKGLPDSGLSGFETDTVKFVTQENRLMGQTDDKSGLYPLWYWKFTGECRLRSLSVVDGENRCPNCGWGPIFCPTCPFNEYDCPKCSHELWVGAKSSYRDRRLHALVVEYKYGRDVLEIVEGETWDGSDFMSISVSHPEEPRPSSGDFRIVTRRAVDWMLKHNMAPFTVVPITVDVSRMNPKQLMKLEAAKVLPPV